MYPFRLFTNHFSPVLRGVDGYGQDVPRVPNKRLQHYEKINSTDAIPFQVNNRKPTGFTA